MGRVVVALRADGAVLLVLDSGGTVAMSDWRDVVSLSDALSKVGAAAATKAGVSPDEVIAWLVHVHDQQSADLLRQIRERQ